YQRIGRAVAGEHREKPDSRGIESGGIGQILVGKADCPLDMEAGPAATLLELFARPLAVAPAGLVGHQPDALLLVHGRKALFRRTRFPLHMRRVRMSQAARALNAV